MQRGRPSGTATSAAPSRGTSSQPSRRAARAGYSAVRSGDDVKIALSTSSGWKSFASRSARSSSSAASSIASRVFAVAVVAPRSPRRILAMALVDEVRVMVITDAALPKGRDSVTACREAVAGGATMIQVRLKDAPAREVLALAGALVGAMSVLLFLQAEDGIRVVAVTGVQTCALPIPGVRPADLRRARRRPVRARRHRSTAPGQVFRAQRLRQGSVRAPEGVAVRAGQGRRLQQIGRASCRERV